MKKNQQVGSLVFMVGLLIIILAGVVGGRFLAGGEER